MHTAALNSHSKVFGLFPPPLLSQLPLTARWRIGIVESLNQETSHLGIKTLLIEPGRFRTKLLSSRNMKAVSSSIPDYADFSKTLLEDMAQADQMQPGDPTRLVEIVLDLVRREGVAEGKEIPLRFPLGSDCYDLVKEKCEETLKLMKEWEPIIKSTDYED